MKISGIKVIIWDFDNTLYNIVPELATDVREAELSVIRAHTGWSREEAVVQFMALYRRIYFSATETTAHLASITFTQAAREMELFIDRGKYLQKDDKLIQMFSKLARFRHVILTNGVIDKVHDSLRILGVSSSTFDLVASSELTGANKPAPRAFSYVLEKTGFLAGYHLMVGDREEVDIIPAKLLGIHTCFVWGVSVHAEYSLPAVYDVPTILT